MVNRFLKPHRLYESLSVSPQESYPRGNEGLNPDACNPVMDQRPLHIRYEVQLQIKKNPDKKFPRK